MCFVVSSCPAPREARTPLLWSPCRHNERVVWERRLPSCDTRCNKRETWPGPNGIHDSDRIPTSEKWRPLFTVFFYVLIPESGATLRLVLASRTPAPHIVHLKVSCSTSTSMIWRSTQIGRNTTEWAVVYPAAKDRESLKLERCALLDAR